MTYSLGYGRHSVSSKAWTYNGWDAADVKKIPDSFMTTSYALDFKVPMLQWMECSDFETCRWSSPEEQSGGGQSGGGQSGGGQNGGQHNVGNNNGGNDGGTSNNGGGGNNGGNNV